MPPEREAGEHEIVISLKSGWSQLVSDLKGCELLRQRVTVAEPHGLNTLWLSLGSLSGCAIFVGAIVFWARRMSAELRDVLVMVLTETSKLVIAISFDLGDLATDLLTTYRVVFEDIVRSPQYRVPYAVFGCLSIMVALVSLAHHAQRARGLRAKITAHAKIQPHPAEADAQLEENEDNEDDAHNVIKIQPHPAEADAQLVENEGSEDDAHKAVVCKLEWELERTSRDLQGLAVGMLSFFLEDIPMVRVRRPAPRR